MRRYASEILQTKSWVRNRPYEAIHAKSEDEIEQGQEENSAYHDRSERDSQVSRFRDVVLVSGSVLTTIVLFLSFEVVFESTLLKDRNPILQHCTYYSPYLEEVEVSTYNTLMNGTLLSPPNPSIARQEPSPENDAAWMSLVDTPIFSLTREEVIKLGKDPETAARFDGQYWGLDEDPYIGKFDISHEIHCLDTLRRRAFTDYPGYNSHEDGTGSRDWIHLGHCVDMLLQFIQCNSDPAVLTMSWVEKQHSPWPDFNINRQCRQFDAMMDWAAGRAFDREKFKDAPRSKGAHVWPNPFIDKDSELGFALGHHHLQEGHAHGDS